MLISPIEPRGRLGTLEDNGIQFKLENSLVLIFFNFYACLSFVTDDSGLPLAIIIENFPLLPKGSQDCFKVDGFKSWGKNRLIFISHGKSDENGMQKPGKDGCGTEARKKKENGDNYWEKHLGKDVVVNVCVCVCVCVCWRGTCVPVGVCVYMHVPEHVFKGAPVCMCMGMFSHTLKSPPSTRLN